MSSPVCIVAGAGPGMGMAVARRFAREGYDLALISRNPAKLSLEMLPKSTHIRTYAADLADGASIERALREIDAAQGEAQVLVYNAAGATKAAPMIPTPDDFGRDLSLSVTGAYAAIRGVWGSMAKAGRGTVLLTGGGFALHPEYGIGLVSLVAGKSGLRGLNFVLHEEMKPFGIHVAMVTIAGMVQAGTAFDPDRIAEHYWLLHSEPKESWRSEIIFTGN